MLNVNNLKIAKIAPNEESRYTLRAIEVTPDYTQATDGHQAIRVTTPKRYTCEQFPAIEGLQATDEHPRFLLDKEHASALVKLLGSKRSIMPVLDCIAVGAETSQNGQSVFGLCANKDLDNQQLAKFKKTEGQYPNIDMVIPRPDEKPVQEFTFNAEMLGNLLLLMSSISDSRNKAMKIKWYKRGDSCLIAFETENAETEQKATAVVMGMRS